MDRTRNSNSVQMDANETKTCDRSANAGEKLAMTEEFKKEVALENEKIRLKGNSKGGKKNKEVTLQLECDLKDLKTENLSRSDTWTDNQTAKKAGVGVGT